jgi:hypothetical protein
VFSRTVSAIMCASGTIADNFAEVTGGRCRPVIEFLPTFVPGQLDRVLPLPDDGACTMREKGVFDVLRTAEILRDRAAGNIKVIMCGEGHAEQSLIEAIGSRGLSATVSFAGQLDATEMLVQYAGADVVVVPTTRPTEKASTMLSPKGCWRAARWPPPASDRLRSTSGNASASRRQIRRRATRLRYRPSTAGQAVGQLRSPRSSEGGITRHRLDGEAQRDVPLRMQPDEATVPGVGGLRTNLPLAARTADLRGCQGVTRH